MSVLRAPVIWLTERRSFRRLAADSAIGRRVAGRFVAGESLDDALRAARELDRRGIASMLDHLGENADSEAMCADAADAYIRALKRIHEAEELDCNISVKLTQLGLDQSYGFCLENTERVLEAARTTLVMIDMEASEYVDRTLRILGDLRARHENVGVAFQSMLRRTAQDVFALPEGTPVRLVKGAYLEPESVAHTSRGEVDRAFAHLLATLVARDHPVHVATHDPRLIDGARRHLHRTGYPWAKVEFQMLYGIRRDLQVGLAREGYPIRTYIPYGNQWYPYLTRRLAERPANMWFFASQLVRGGGGKT
ncbi:MAG: proline dehydrogenase family protein [Actinobacteria bacterium]|nr:proline dehydrogenase family protein [Actinomycetota bacterium]